MLRVLPLEIIVAGVVAAWLLTVVPAGLITVLKGRWDLFGWGFLSFGLPWFGAAVRLAPADSGWARRRYSEQQLALAELPFGRQYPRRTVVAWSAAAAAAVVLLGALIVRPAPVLGISGESLGDSLPERGGDYLSLSEPLPPCEQEEGNLWICSVYDPLGSGTTTPYEVRVNGKGCWTARPVAKGAGQRRLNGCIWLPDYFE